MVVIWQIEPETRTTYTYSELRIDCGSATSLIISWDHRLSQVYFIIGGWLVVISMTLQNISKYWKCISTLFVSSMILICCIISIGSSLLAPMWITSHLNKINMFLSVLVLSFNDVYHLHEGVDNSIKTFDSLLHYVIQHFVSVQSHRCLML